MNHNPEELTKQEPRWRRFERGQALMEYWPTIPVGVAVMIVASALMPIMTNAFQKTADGLTGIECEVIEPSGSGSVDLAGGHNIDMSSYVYDPDNDRTTIAFTVTSGSQPSISHWVLGIDQETASRIVSSTEAYQPWGLDPATGKYGIKFDKGYDGGGGKGKAAAGTGLVLASGGTLNFVAYTAQTANGETRTIVLTLSGNVTLTQTEVTTKAGSNQVSTGELSTPSTPDPAIIDGDC